MYLEIEEDSEEEVNKAILIILESGIIIWAEP
jgi:hypothetical protein